MKRYISAILIPCLLMQLFGCYSFRDITVDELREYKGAGDVKILTKKGEILINRDSTETYIKNWQIEDSSIIVQKITFTEINNVKNPINKKNEIKFNQIKGVAIEESDSKKTVGLIFFSVICVAAITVAIISLSKVSFVSFRRR